ncbi:MAG: diacylglycerol kinase family protein [Clostridia bacterium]|nr:diacylglycerol kinase family protein [Clostridia bacterium]
MKALLKSFVYAGKGIISCIRCERNMRIHFVCMVYMYCFLGLYDFFQVSRTQFAILFVANAIVMMGELINTSIESAVNLVEQKHNENYNKIAELAKDTAAGAVLIGAIFAVAVGIAILWQPVAFKAMFQYYKENIFMFVALVISIIISTIFIFAGPDKMLGINKKKQG